MKRIPFSLLCFILLSVTFSLRGQTPEIDSLENLLSRHSRKNTTRIRLLNATARALYQNDNERMYELASEAIQLADKLNDRAGLAEGIRIQGKYHYSKSEIDKAESSFHEAMALFEKLGNQAGVARCLDHLGRVYWRQGDYESARDHIGQALDIATTLEDHNLISTSLSSFGILSLQQGQYSEALKYLQESNIHARLGGNLENLSSNLHNLGYLYMRQSNYEEAIRCFEETRVLMEKLGDEQGISGIYLNMGIIYSNQGQFLEAIDYYQRSSEIDERFGDKQGVSRCLNNIGLIYQSQGNYPLALDYIQRSLTIKEEIGDIRGKASCLMNIGGIHGDQGDHEKALEYFHPSLEIFEELEDKPGISLCLFHIGSTNGNLGAIPEALAYLQKALVMLIELGERYSESACLANLGSTYGKLGDHAQALDHYRKALAIKEEISDRQGMCSIFLQIGLTYLETGNFSQAMEYTLKSLVMARELELLDEQARIYKQLSDIYRATGNYPKAYENHILHKELYDSLFNLENVRRLTGLEFEFNNEREKQAMELEQQKKDALMEAEARRLKILRNSFMAGFALMILVAALILRNFMQKRKANRILEERNRKIAMQKDAITDSISYASRIQQAMHPPEENTERLLQEHFILNRPRDIVSGDFYWLAEKNRKLNLVLADCTGHGVPGAFMSMLGIAFLNELVNSREESCSNQILNQLRDHVIQSLHQTGKRDEAHDGMELAFCTLDREHKQLQFSGANRPLYLVRKSQLTEIKGDRMPIGYYGDHLSFTCHQQQLKENDCIYLFSDGYVDQVGGPDKKAFRKKRFRELLCQNSEKDMKEQKQILEDTLDEWQGTREQIDDILVIGLRV